MSGGCGTEFWVTMDMSALFMLIVRSRSLSEGW
jgi:hypothetical protein